MRFLRVLRVTGCVVGLGMCSMQGQDLHTQMAIIGAHTAGGNYQWGVVCNAGPELLSAFKAKKQVSYSGAGARFEPEFAAGRAEVEASFKDLASKVGEAKARQDVCRDGKYVAEMQAGLAKK